MTRPRSPTAETSHPLCDVGLKSDAGLLPIGRNIDADVVLLDQDMSDPLLGFGGEYNVIDRLPFSSSTSSFERADPRRRLPA